ncbi:STE3-domain-containing protein [Coprinopsis marcescibilis]|uniref:STE3-domain-containing protein n=1 Tax=Coprinopsis marcescibilis TaxID=230819 RepID=A0A5C3KH56_COPMA|nr:STE3-domain-containing protein [Coprinopsis marcescibilis]
MGADGSHNYSLHMWSRSTGMAFYRKGDVENKRFIELPINAFLVAVLVLIPTPWHWRARNIPTLSIIAWHFVSNIICGVNAIIWAGNVELVAPVWCDIVTRIQTGATVALPVCCLCLCVHLERIASVRQTGMKPSDRRRREIVDGALCWGIPAIYMALHYVVQGHRFDSIEDLGCRPALYVSLASIFIISVPPLLVVVLTFIFGGLALYHFFQRRLTFARHLQTASSALAPSRYFRLMAMAIVQMLWGGFGISLNMWSCTNGLLPYTSWDDVHHNFWEIWDFPHHYFNETAWAWTFVSWWSIPASSVLFFVFFAFGDDARKEYGAFFASISRVIGCATWRKSYDIENLKRGTCVSRTSTPAFKRQFDRDSDYSTPVSPTTSNSTTFSIPASSTTTLHRPDSIYSSTKLSFKTYQLEPFPFESSSPASSDFTHVTFTSFDQSKV